MKKFATLIAAIALTACGIVPQGPYKAINSKSDVRKATLTMHGVCDVNRKDFCYSLNKGDKVIVRSMRDNGKTARVLMAGEVTVDVPAANLKK